MPAAENSVWKLLQDLSNKKGISEISINSPKEVFVEREGKFIQLNVALTKNDIAQFITEVAQFNHKTCNQDNPIMDGVLPDGSRINIITAPFVQSGAAISIRKYIKSIQTFHSNPGIFGLFDKWVQFFKAVINARLNIIVAGGTGVGKTTFLNLLLQEVNPQERIVTIEDTLELNFRMPNLVRLEAGAKTVGSSKIMTTADLVKNTLRMRPDRIIIGEVRGAELFDLLQAMNTGHDGCMCSIHASSSAECLQRMETLFLLAGFDVPHRVVRRQIASGVDLIIQLSRERDGRRVVSEITEVTGMEGDTILMSKLAIFDDEGLKSTGVTSTKMDRLHVDGGLPRDFFN
jgi:pilus assembly protein CpaF